MNDRGEIIGWTAEKIIPASGQRIIESTKEATNVENNLDLQALKIQKIAEIKDEVRIKLAEIEWRVERARERDVIGVGGETLIEVYAEREAIRRAGNRAELAVLSLNEADKINLYRLEILDIDRITPSKITRLAFVRRFTAEERLKIAAERSNSQEINDWWTLLDLARNVDLHDPEIIIGIKYLEAIHILESGRADAILACEV